MYEVTDKFKTIDRCCVCGIAFMMPENYRNGRLKEKDTFHCPNGHAQHFLGESDKERIRRLTAQLDVERTRLRQAENQAAKLHQARKAVSTRLRKMKQRVSNGVCPCCTRSFQNLQRHIATKHPDFGKETLT